MTARKVERSTDQGLLGGWSVQNQDLEPQMSARAPPSGRFQRVLVGFRGSLTESHSEGKTQHPSC